MSTRRVFRVVIDTEGEAFTDAPSIEIGRILRSIAAGMEDTPWQAPSSGVRNDINGNTVASWSFLMEGEDL